MGKGNGSKKAENEWWRNRSLESSIRLYLSDGKERHYQEILNHMESMGWPSKSVCDSLEYLARDGLIFTRDENINGAFIDHIYWAPVAKKKGPKEPSRNGKCEFIGGMLAVEGVLIGEAEPIRCSLYKKDGMLTRAYKDMVCHNKKPCAHKDLLKRLMEADPEA